MTNQISPILGGGSNESMQAEIAEITKTIFAGVDAFFREKIRSNASLSQEVLEASLVKDANFFLDAIITAALNIVYPQDPNNIQAIHPMATRDYLYNVIYNRPQKKLLSSDIWRDLKPARFIREYPEIVNQTAAELAKRLQDMQERVGENDNLKLQFVHQFLADIDKIKTGYYAGPQDPFADEYGLVTIEFIWKKIFERAVNSISNG